MKGGPKIRALFRDEYKNELGKYSIFVKFKLWILQPET
jgi:hypothetical protein